MVKKRYPEPRILHDPLRPLKWYPKGLSGERGVGDPLSSSMVSFISQIRPTNTYTMNDTKEYPVMLI